ncbi:STAS domain-containing protein [Sorangium sp. So ce136]|uniref:STAS domain-containing protein n=1 Tax=Sorangium sp. So ce136 TaxID=3133284 RepID=UPI003F524448
MNGVTIAVLEGDVDGNTARDLERELGAILADSRQVLLDMSRVGYVSSAGLRLLLLIYRMARSRGGKVSLLGLSAEIRDVMDSTGFLQFFLLTETEEEGLAMLETAGAV